MIKKDESLQDNAAVIVQVEPEKRPFQYPAEVDADSSSQRAIDLDYSTNENVISSTDSINVPEPGYNLSHCKVRDFRKQFDCISGLLSTTNSY